MHHTMPSKDESSLKHFPIAFFAVLMGLWGWTLASDAASEAGIAPGGLADVLRVFALIASMGVYVIFAIKALRWPSELVKEWRSPPKLAFFPGFSISLLLVATAFQEKSPVLAEAVWVVAAVIQGVLTLSVISSWISHRPFEIGQLSPAWFIPAVGNVVAPVAGAQFGYIEISWLFFSGGLIFWLVLLTLVVNRLMFHDPLPERLLPTLVIMIAPPSVAFLAYLSLTGQFDPFARILLNIAYVFALLVLIQAPKFRKLPFALTWWALSFPVAALSVASFRFGVETGISGYSVIGGLVWVLLSVILIGLVLKTGKIFLKGGFFRPEG